MLRRLEELDRLDARHGLGTDPRSVPPRPSGGGLTRRGAVPAAVVVVLLVGATLAIAPAAAPLRALLGLERHGDPPAYAEGEGSYAFLLTQPGSDEPVGYDPCSVIEVVIDPSGAPDDHRELVDVAIDRVSSASGLELEVVGEVSRRPDAHEELAREGLAPPVLVAWSDAAETPELDEAAGLGGSSAVEVGGRLGLVTGVVILDVDDFAEMEGDGYPPGARQSVVDHELGHVVGLDHVDDPGEVMNAEGAATVFGPGDLEGLARLGGIACR